MTDSISLTCGKCSGDGVISGFEHYADGICFDCQGRGTVGKVTREKYRKMIAHALIGTADIVIMALADGNRDRAEFYSRLMVPKLFMVGTDEARKVLDYVAAGRGWDNHGAGNRMVLAPADDAAELRTYLIDCGRAAKEAARSL